MVEFVTGNLLEADVDALVNTVNTEGVMGKGVALQFKRAFPANYTAYRSACEAGEVTLGRMFVFTDGPARAAAVHHQLPDQGPLALALAPERHRRRPGDLRRVLAELQVESVAVPPLGCGLGGLRWSDVRPRIESALAELPVRALVFEPRGAPMPEQMRERRSRPR